MTIPERKPQTEEGKKLFQYVKAYIDVKGVEAEANFKKWESSHFNFAKKLDEVLGSVELFKEMLNSYGAFLTKNGKTNWNMRTMANHAEKWKERDDKFKKKYPPLKKEDVAEVTF